jgi:glycerol-3-phosphate cytidylyltransferase-like family protein
MQCKNTNWWNVTNNRVWDNYGPGIFVGGQNCTIYKNEVTGSKNCTPGGDGSRGDGIIIDRSDTTEGGRYNTLTANMVCDNEGYDIIVQPGKPGNAGDNNTCYTTSNYGDTGAGAGECTYRCFTVEGHCSPVNGGLAVDITNLETDDKWDANIDTTNDDYSLLLKGERDPTAAGSADIRAGETLRIHACDNISSNERACNVTDHDVTSGEITAGGFTEDLTLNHFCRNYLTFPYRTWEESNWSGPAVMEMLIDHYRDPPDVPDQTELNETGIGYNQGCNADLPYVDPRGVKHTLNKYLHAYNGLPYVANYGIGSYGDIDDVLHYMCKWHYLGPGAAPVYGNYSNWMAVRGIHTDVKPTFTQGSYTIYGFWMNDPYNEMLEGPGGIGENTYKSVEQWKSTYHLKLNKSDVDPTDIYYDKYVAVCEPPEDDNVEVTLAKPKPRLDDVIRPALTGETLVVYDTEQPVLEMAVKDEELLKIIRAAIDGVTEELLPYDMEFADVFAKTTAGDPVFVAAEAGNYYLVPFNTRVVEISPVKTVPVGIEKSRISGLKEIEYVDEDILTKPIPIEPIKVEKTLVVVLVDGEDGSFKEASWVADPVKYLPVSKAEALKLALSEIDITDKDSVHSLKSKPTIEIVYRDASPYYPDWKITIGDEVYFVGQDGTVSQG